MTSSSPIRLGYKASAEQFGPSELLSFSLQAERLGFDDVACSDHFQPWRHHGGHSPAVLPWLGALGARGERVRMGTSVLTPTFRYHPAVVAQAFATLGCLFPGRVFLGVGTGESMNETPITAGEWPPIKERRRRLAEAIELIRRLWREERLDFQGEYYETRKATIYDRPDDAGADLRRRLRAARREARRPLGRRVHLHERQGPRPLREAARGGRGGRRGRGPGSPPASRR